MNLAKALRRRAVLLVDNNRETMDADALRLGPGYTVYKAANRQEALQRVAEHLIHLLVIDGRLLDETEEDNSGISLSREPALAAYPRILFSHFTKEIWNRSYRQPGLNVDFQMKGVDKIEEFVDAAFSLDPDLQTKAGIEHAKVGINFDQQLIYAPGVSRFVLVDLLRDSPREGEALIELAAEIEDVLGRAFVENSALRIALPATPQGRSGSFVLLVTPWAGAEWKRPFIVKCGPRERITNEVEAYTQHVEHGSDYHARLVSNTRLVHLGVLKYEVLRHVRPFADFYQAHDSSLVRKVIRNLFQETGRPWYYNLEAAGRKDEQAQLLESYQEKVLFATGSQGADPSPQWADLEAAIDRVIAGHALVKKHGTDLRWEIEDTPLVWPNPSTYLSTLRGRSSALFPRSFMKSRCHGDLHAQNILVDDEMHPWLIDFEHTDYGPLLLDAVALESSIHFSLLKEERMERLLALEQSLAQQPKLDAAINLPAEPNEAQESPLQKAAAVIAALRHEAAAIPGARSADYFLGLAVHALRAIYTGERTALADPWSPTSYEMQALFMASAYCQRLRVLEAELAPPPPIKPAAVSHDGQAEVPPPDPVHRKLIETKVTQQYGIELQRLIEAIRTSEQRQKDLEKKHLSLPDLERISRDRNEAKKKRLEETYNSTVNGLYQSVTPEEMNSIYEKWRQIIDNSENRGNGL